MFASAPDEENLHKIDRNISKLAEALERINQVKVLLEQTKPPNLKELLFAIKKQTLNLENSQKALQEARDPGFFAWMARGSQIMELQMNPNLANTNQNIQQTNLLIAQITQAMTMNHPRDPARDPTNAVTVSSRERGRQSNAEDVPILLTRLESRVNHFIENKLDLNSLTYDDTDLRKEIRNIVTQIDSCIKMYEKAPENTQVQFSQVKDNLENMRTFLNANHSEIANLPDKPRVENESQTQFRMR